MQDLDETRSSRSGQPPLSPGADRAAGEIRHVHVNGRQLAVQIRGTGPTIVMEMGGGFGGIGPYWFVDGELAKFCRVITYDRAGIGLSARIRTRPTLGERAQDLGALLDALGEQEKLLFVGWSLGGLVLQNFSARFPERVGGLLLLDPTPPDLMSKSGGIGRWMFSAFFGVSNAVQLMLARAGFFRSKRGRNWLRDFARKHSGSGLSPENFELFIDALASPDFHRAMILEANKLPQLCRETLSLLEEKGLPDVPAIVLEATHRVGAAAKLGPEMYDRLREFLPKAEFRTLAGVSHLVPAEAPESVIQAVRDLLPRIRTNAREPERA